MDFDFHSRKSIPVNEVVFVFMNDRAGDIKKGLLDFRRVDFRKRTTPLPSSASTKTMTSQSIASKTSGVETSLPLRQPAGKPQYVQTTADVIVGDPVPFGS